MATITPFRGIVYNTGKSRQNIRPRLSALRYHLAGRDSRNCTGRARHNVIRLEYGLASPGDTDEDNRYTRAAAVLEDWSRSTILQQEQDPGLLYI